MATFLSLLLLSSSALVHSSPIVNARSPYSVKESHKPSPLWSAVASAPEDHVLDLHIGMKQSNFEELERHLYEVSDPDHSRYGKHLSAAEVNKLVAPSEETSRLVHEWLAENGVHSADCEYNAAKDFIKVSLPVSAIESLLDAKYSIFKHRDDGALLVRTTEWSLPRHLHEHIDIIQPTTSFMRPKAHAATYKISSSKVTSEVMKTDAKISSAQPSVCNTAGVTTECLRTYYGTINYKPQSAGKNHMGHTNYLGEISNYSDVTQFLGLYRKDANFGGKKPFDTFLINNGSNSQAPEPGSTGLEANLDSETMLGIGYPTPLTTYNTGGSPPFKPDIATTTNTNEPYLEWVNFILNQTDIPQVISTSYGDDEQTVPFAYASSVCKLFAQLGARGTSLFFSSGDSGVGRNGTCFSNDGTNRAQFVPSFPASCPYVTTVGATKNFAPEVAAYDAGNGFSSGGGYSNYFEIPDYQKDVVANYTASLAGKFKGQFNTSGRAYPDISAQGQAFITIWKGAQHLLDGTSASSPLAASIFSLVNDALITAGKSPLGFLNPWLYKKGYAAFNDITSGSALGCGGSGFVAQSGWDPVTGWGTPKFADLLKLAGVDTLAKN